MLTGLGKRTLVAAPTDRPSVWIAWTKWKRSSSSRLWTSHARSLAARIASNITKRTKTQKRFGLALPAWGAKPEPSLVVPRRIADSSQRWLARFSSGVNRLANRKAGFLS
jgi:hypothetical protein